MCKCTCASARMRAFVCVCAEREREGGGERERQRDRDRDRERHRERLLFFLFSFPNVKFSGPCDVGSLFSGAEQQKRVRSRRVSYFLPRTPALVMTSLTHTSGHKNCIESVHSPYSPGQQSRRCFGEDRVTSKLK